MFSSLGLLIYISNNWHAHELRLIYQQRKCTFRNFCASDMYVTSELLIVVIEIITSLKLFLRNNWWLMKVETTSLIYNNN